MHILSRTATAIASHEKFHPDLRGHIPMLKQMGDSSEDRNGLSWQDMENRPEWLETLDAVVTEYGFGADIYSSGVYSLPFLTKEYCEALLDEIALMSFEVNPDEEAQVQIPEITLKDTCPALFSCLYGLFNEVVKPLSKVLFQLEPTKMSSIQFAQYTPDEVDGGHWHHDKDSDVTLVVALSDFHEGGGTMVKPQGLGEPFAVPQLPTGHAMLFQGSKTLHYGLPVTEGARNLLVFWSEIK